MSEVTAGIVQPATKVIRVQMSHGVTYEVTKTANQALVETAAEDTQYRLELISGDVASDDLGYAEFLAIAQAESDWAELAKKGAA